MNAPPRRTIGPPDDAFLIGLLHPEFVEKFYKLSLEISISLHAKGGIDSRDDERMRPIRTRDALFMESYLPTLFWDALVRKAPKGPG